MSSAYHDVSKTECRLTGDVGWADDLDAVYSAQDSITITFSEFTNKADPEFDPYFSQLEIDTLLVFSQVLGSTYSGLWLDRRYLNSRYPRTIVFVCTRAWSKVQNIRFWIEGCGVIVYTDFGCGAAHCE